MAKSDRAIGLEVARSLAYRCGDLGAVDVVIHTNFDQDQDGA